MGRWKDFSKNKTNLSQSFSWSWGWAWQFRFSFPIDYYVVSPQKNCLVCQFLRIVLCRDSFFNQQHQQNFAKIYRSLFDNSPSWLKWLGKNSIISRMEHWIVLLEIWYSLYSYRSPFKYHINFILDWIGGKNFEKHASIVIECSLKYGWMSPI